MDYFLKHNPPVTELIKQFGISHKGFYRWLRDAGVKTERQIARNRDPEFRKALVDYFTNNLVSVNQVARHFNYAYPSTYQILCEERCDTKYRNGCNRKPVIGNLGYVLLYQPTHPHANVDGYVKEHIVKATKALGRKLNKDECVHHINGDRADNRNCNLLICTKSYHGELHSRMAQLYQAQHFPKLAAA